MPIKSRKLSSNKRKRRQVASLHIGAMKAKASDARRSVRWLEQVVTGQRQAVLMTGAILITLAVVFCTKATSVNGSKYTAKQRTIERARMSDEKSLHAAGQGNPWINLSDGHELITPYSGPVELTHILERNQAQPLSLCSADFDEDGVPDLISGYAGANGGIVTLSRGNVDSIYPNAPEAKQRKAEGNFTDAPFLSPAFVFSVPEGADFIGAGDFDGDGHWDVVTAARGSNKLYLLSGDGKGGLRETKRLDLPGGVTAMVVGEINRRDGLDDVVVGVSGEQGSKVLVFEGPEGALRASPEAFGLPAEATSLALGQLDDSYELDLALAAGHELMIVHGRDRMLPLDAQRQVEVWPAHIEKRVFPFTIRSIALGDFRASQSTDIALLADDGKLRVLTSAEAREGGGGGEKASAAIQHWSSSVEASISSSAASKLLSARLSNSPIDNILVVDPGNQNVEVIAPRAEALKEESAERSDAPEQMTEITLKVDGNPKAAVPLRLNGDALSDLMVLRAGHIAPVSVTTTAAATFTVTNTNDSGPGSLRQAIIDANFNSGADAINFNIGSGVKTITPLSPLPALTDSVVIDGTTQPGFAGKPVVELSGVNTPEALALASGNSTVRGLVINRFATLSGFGIFIHTMGGNRIEGNFIGTDDTATGALGNGFGLAIFSSSNTIGGTAPAASNTISGNTFSGVVIQGAGATSNIVQGNFIGTNSTGTLGVGNSNTGIFIYGGTNNTIGGMSPGARNLLSGNGFPGVAICDYQGSPAAGNVVQGNYIGTDISGTVDVGNSFDGISIDAPNTLIGGTTVSARNVISGNDSDGIEIKSNSARNNLVQGNFIGTDALGIRRLGNGQFGVMLTQTAEGNTIGGVVAGARNIISASGQHGIGLGIRTTVVCGSGGDLLGQIGAVVQGNYIGTDVNGTSPLGNTLCGIFVEVNSVGNRIEGNLIAFNGESGICIPNLTPNSGAPGVKISIVSNLIFSNIELGVDLGDPGVTPNDALDVDVGANQLQNFPALTSVNTFLTSNRINGVLPTTATATITGILNSTPNSTFTLQFFFGGNCSSGQGSQFTGTIPVVLGTTQVTTNGSGVASYSISLPLPSAAISGGWINATATDTLGNTSEQSECARVTTIPPAGPTIAGACKGEGKLLFIFGSGFVDGAKVLINGDVEKKTRFVSSTEVIAFKAGKRAFAGDSLRVRNPDGAETTELTYTQVACPP